MAKGTTDKRRISTPAAIGIGVLAFVVVGGGLWWENWAMMKPREATPPNAQLFPLPKGTKLYDPAKGPKLVHYQSHTLVAQGPAVSLPERQMAVVGTTDEGYLLTERLPATARNRSWPVGGGGGKPGGTQNAGLPALPQAEGPVYLKTPDDRFVPVTQQN